MHSNIPKHLTTAHFSCILSNKAARRRQAADEAATATILICGECGRIYPLHECERRNAERLLLQCPGCGALLLRYTVRQPVEVDDLPEFVAEHYT